MGTFILPMLASCGIYITLICHKKLYFKNKIESIEEQLTNRAGDQGLKIKKTFIFDNLESNWLSVVYFNQQMHACARIRMVENNRKHLKMSILHMR